MRSFALTFSVPQKYDSLDDILDSNIDAVYVATHPDSHAEICLKSLAAGKHVVCEKPAALNVRQLQEVLAAARHHDRLFMEAMKPPFYPALLPPSPASQSQPHWTRRLHPGRPFRLLLAPDFPLHFAELGGGGIMGIGPYEVFLALDWLGPLKRVQTMGRVSPGGVDAFALFQTEHERGWPSSIPVWIC